jgi:hypothetical protein
MFILCYELWKLNTDDSNEMVGAYWDVQEAWRNVRMLRTADPASDYDVLVANGMQYDVVHMIEMRRTDVK